MNLIYHDLITNLEITGLTSPTKRSGANAPDPVLYPTISLTFSGTYTRNTVFSINCSPSGAILCIAMVLSCDAVTIRALGDSMYSEDIWSACPVSPHISCSSNPFRLNLRSIPLPNPATTCLLPLLVV